MSNEEQKNLMKLLDEWEYLLREHFGLDGFEKTVGDVRWQENPTAEIFEMRGTFQHHGKPHLIILKIRKSDKCVLWGEVIENGSVEGTVFSRQEHLKVWLQNTRPKS